jgi:hypothetical protein
MAFGYLSAQNYKIIKETGVKNAINKKLPVKDCFI